KNHLHACDAVAHEQTWADIVRLQSEGVYPAALAAIRCPALMLHGDDDPHPGTMIHNSLKPFLPQLEYVSWPHCGHYPWLEKTAQCPFYTTLTRWLKAIP
ncbi:MAG: alpha/beta fold hydrolase, partial [Planctomycetota bacterium]